MRRTSPAILLLTQRRAPPGEEQKEEEFARKEQNPVKALPKSSTPSKQTSDSPHQCLNHILPGKWHPDVSPLQSRLCSLACFTQTRCSSSLVRALSDDGGCSALPGMPLVGAAGGLGAAQPDDDLLAHCDGQPWGWDRTPTRTRVPILILTLTQTVILTVAPTIA